MRGANYLRTHWPAGAALLLVLALDPFAVHPVRGAHGAFVAAAGVALVAATVVWLRRAVDADTIRRPAAEPPRRLEGRAVIAYALRDEGWRWRGRAPEGVDGRPIPMPAALAVCDDSAAGGAGGAVLCYCSELWEVWHDVACITPELARQRATASLHALGASDWRDAR